MILEDTADRSQTSSATGFTPVETGLCTTPIPSGDETRVVQKPVNHWDKPSGEPKLD